MFLNLKLFLETPKHKTNQVTYSKTEKTTASVVALSGLINDGYLSNELCNSVTILNNTVLKRFNITTRSANEDIRTLAEQICMEHQNALLVPELLAKNGLFHI
ncbi:MAG: hypothetical protein ACRCXC_02770 [Legionella sp.]